MNVRELAKFVRDEAETWARAVGYDHVTLCKQCAVTSLAFIAAAGAVGIEVALAAGYFAGTDPPDPHFWVMAWENRTCLLVDLTATQYIDDAPRAAVMTAADPATELYLIAWADDEARRQVRWRDLDEADELTDRVMLALAAKGILVEGEPCR